MRVKSVLIYQHEKTYQTTKNYIIRVKMKLVKLPSIKKKEFPQDYKFNWIAYNLENTQERILFDNHHGKRPHYHLNQDKKGVFFSWLSREKSETLFWEKVEQKFGSPKKQI